MSKETKFTRGKLEAFDESVIDGYGNLIVEFNGVGTSWSEDEANALLFKTAPKLYYVLDKITEMQARNYGDGMKTHIDLIDLVNEAKALLAEVRGEQ